MGIVKSVYDTNEELIRNLMLLHGIDQFDLDCTYSEGKFWKNLPQPSFKSDLYPKYHDVIEASSDNLPFREGSLRSIMFDPPFVIGGKDYKESKEGSCQITKRFESYTSFDLLKRHYYDTIKECYRLLKQDGLLVFKCQDVVAGGRNHFSHCAVMNMAVFVGFYPLDLFILTAKSRINSFGSKWKTQQHARKYHSYFWVFKKTKNKVDYSWE